MKFVLIAATCLTSYAASAGGYSGGGADSHEIGYGAAWFTGKSQISYCIEKSNDFGLSLDEIQKDFDSAAKIWRDYILDRGIQKSYNPAQPELNLNFQYTGRCKGGENLRLYFGVDTPEVVRQKKRYENPYAFVSRESYDLSSGMGKGFAWFAKTGGLYRDAGPVGFPNWTRPYTLHGMMLHELGHILGVGHMEGTIMQSDLMGSMQFMDSSEAWSQSRGKAILTNIDDLKILYFHWQTRIEVEGRISYAKDAQKSIETFKKFMGRAPVGEVRSKVSLGSPLKLTMSDDHSSHIFNFETPLDLRSSFSLLSNLFGVFFVDPKVGYKTVISTGSSGYSGIGTTTTVSGSPVTVQYRVNAYGLWGPVKLMYIDNGSPKELFVSNIKGSLLD